MFAIDAVSFCALPAISIVATPRTTRMPLRFFGRHTWRAERVDIVTITCEWASLVSTCLEPIDGHVHGCCLHKKWQNRQQLTLSGSENQLVNREMTVASIHCFVVSPSKVTTTSASMTVHPPAIASAKACTPAAYAVVLLRSRSGSSACSRAADRKMGPLADDPPPSRGSTSSEEPGNMAVLSSSCL